MITCAVTSVYHFNYYHKLIGGGKFLTLAATGYGDEYGRSRCLHGVSPRQPAVITRQQARESLHAQRGISRRAQVLVALSE